MVLPAAVVFRYVLFRLFLARMYLQHAQYHFALSPHPHMAYSSYNPVSRQDSELQSLSSDARTESDNMSLKENSV